MQAIRRKRGRKPELKRGTLLVLLLGMLGLMLRLANGSRSMHPRTSRHKLAPQRYIGRRPPARERTTYRAAKRLLDIIFAAIALVLAGPTMLVIAGLVRWRIGSPVIFKQTRPGEDGKPFTIYKFRTMSNQRDANGHLMPDGDRLTQLGALLRRTSLDELPELFNVFKGEMSLVGPRPLLMQYLGLYTPQQARRHEARPGITGWAQVNGRNSLAWEEKFALDLFYVENATLWFDLKILLKTVGTILRRNGVNQAGHATVAYYTGAPAPTRTTAPEAEREAQVA